MSKPWGGSGIGSWAAEAEREELENAAAAAAMPAAASTTAANPQSFPSLREAVSTTKPKKKKMTLSEFNTLSSTPSGYGSTRLTPDEMLQLPTGPKLRGPVEYGGGPRLGGGFSSYGDDRRGGPQGRRFDDDRRGGPPARRGPEFEAMPSRADEVDNWASAKRVVLPQETNNRGSRYGALGGGSRADEVDNWSFGKKPAAAPPPGPRSGGFGSGFRDSGSDWRREREEPRPREALSVVVIKERENRSSPFGAARPREDVLAEKGLDWKKLEMEIEAKKAVSVSGSSRPTSSQGGSRPTSSHSNRSESVGGGGADVVRPRPRVNPFGDAKPREVLLEEKGLDWRKIDLQLEHRRVDRPETEQEKVLKEEIGNLKKELGNESGNDFPQGSDGEQSNICDIIQSKERELETLIRELDDKVRFGQKAVERPGSGAGRFSSYPERPPSQSGSFDDVRGPEPMDRPRSRGTGDVWTRPGEDRRGGFQSGRDRGFLSNRDFDRSRSRERW